MSEASIQEKIRQQVLGKVHSGTVHIKSHAHFVVRAGLTVILSFFSLFISALVLSFIAFSVRESGELFLLGFGVRGLLIFVTLFPYLPFLIDVVIIFALQWLLSGFSFGYRFSVLSLFGIVFGTSAGLGLLLYLSPIHSALLWEADRGSLPIFGGLYEHLHDSHHEQGVYRGVVLGIQNDRLILGHNDGDTDIDDGMRTVLLQPGDADKYYVGQHIFILGTSTGEGILPYGMQSFDASPR